MVKPSDIQAHPLGRIMSIFATACALATLGAACASRQPDQNDSRLLIDDSPHRWTKIDAAWSACETSASAMEFPPFPEIFRVRTNAEGTGYVINPCSSNSACTEESAFGSIFREPSKALSTLQMSPGPSSGATLIGSPVLRWKDSEDGTCLYTLTAPELLRDQVASSWILRVAFEEYLDPKPCEPESFQSADRSPRCQSQRSATATQERP